MELIKNKSGGKIMAEFIGARSKTVSYLIDDSGSMKKLKEQKRVYEV